MSDLMNKDLDHLKSLTIGFYVYTVMCAVWGLLFVIHLVIGIQTLRGKIDWGNDPPDRVFGWVFVGAGSFAILLGLTQAVCNFFAARFLSRRTKYTFCFVLGAISCMFVPFGTLLGVFTIIVLSRESVKQLFGRSIQPITGDYDR